ncbi:hypothetical protein [Streptomyces sp. NPDC048057]|uniref:hypothetical protein n=1 Tax=Streptomyces sp. NPDC048057 TaxID=3155628 RepID=UPI0033D5AA50
MVSAGKGAEATRQIAEMGMEPVWLERPRRADDVDVGASLCNLAGLGVCQLDGVDAMQRTGDHRRAGGSPPGAELGPAHEREVVRPSNEAQSAMTIRVYRVGVDGTRWPVEREVSVVAGKDVPAEPMKFPPCTCPRCARRVW